MVQETYRVLPGPEAYLAPAAAMMGVMPPDSGSAIVEGSVVSEDEAIAVIARKLADAKNPAVCPGPLLIWQWDDGVSAKAAAVRELAEACGAKILPMIDYSARRIRTDMEISPNHPNVTILQNDIDVCLFAGVHSHYANYALRLIRARTDCYTIVLGDYSASEDAMASLRDINVDKINAITEKIKSLKRG
ncbi:MAG: hypothetical protein LBU70_00270 [Chitinispirillales bacterium]|jgi:hypothetical protein|nr:hypothetical protein [Chitinispirillales bacterium]